MQRVWRRSRASTFLADASEAVLAASNQLNWDLIRADKDNTEAYAEYYDHQKTLEHSSALNSYAAMYSVSNGAYVSSVNLDLASVAFMTYSNRCWPWRCKAGLLQMRACFWASTGSTATLSFRWQAKKIFKSISDTRDWMGSGRAWSCRTLKAQENELVLRKHLPRSKEQIVDGEYRFGSGKWLPLHA